MRIGGLIKQSFIDWDGYVVAVIFTKGCNFRCSYCHNPDLVLSELLNESEDLSENIVFDYLNKRKCLLDGVVVSGGEPTIHQDLKELLLKIKSLGLKTKLDTNGSNPLLLEELLRDNLVDYVALDIKTLLQTTYYFDITNVMIENLVEKVKHSINILKTSGVEYQLRTTLIPSHHNQNIAKMLKEQLGKESNYVFQQYRDTKNIVGNYLNVKV